MPIIEQLQKRKVMRLYHYTTQRAFDSILYNRKMKLTRPWYSNDITEGIVVGESMRHEYFKRYGYISFSICSSSPSMWGYYADKSEGVCLIFDFPYCDEEDAGVRYLGMKCEQKLWKVQYGIDRPNRENIYDVLCTKSSDWKHEQEYRMLYSLYHMLSDSEIEKGDDIKLVYYDTEILSFLSGVILGVNNHREIEDIRNFGLKALDKPFFYVTKARLDNRKFLIDTCEEQTCFLDHLSINKTMESRGTKILGDYMCKKYVKSEKSSPQS